MFHLIRFVFCAFKENVRFKTVFFLVHIDDGPLYGPITMIRMYICIMVIDYIKKMVLLVEL